MHVARMQVYIYFVCVDGGNNLRSLCLLDGYTLVAFEFDVCYLFSLAQFLIDSGMSVVADQRYMKWWSEVLAPRAYCT
jgi:hypothetical protein